MKNLCNLLVLTLTLLGALSTFGFAADKPVSLEERVSYGIGMNIAHDFEKQEFKVDPELLARGIKDAQAGGETLMSDEEVQATITELQTLLKDKQAEKAKVIGEANKKSGAEFLAANAKKDGVKTTASGLQYKVIEAGTGKAPAATDKVKVNYRGTLVDGTEFDSSYKRGQPATFPVNGVIKGWTEALQLMKEGAKYQLFIPAELAYGERGAGPMIGPNSTLVFDVELLAINPE
jgi:FKBP-type peptidyl-prolyl cis-trans isomerase FklB